MRGGKLYADVGGTDRKSSLPLDEFTRAAEAADVNLIIADVGRAVQPGTRGLFGLRRQLSELEEAFLRIF